MVGVEAECPFPIGYRQLNTPKAAPYLHKELPYHSPWSLVRCKDVHALAEPQLDPSMAADQTSHLHQGISSSSMSPCLGSSSTAVHSGVQWAEGVLKTFSCGKAATVKQNLPPADLRKCEAYCLLADDEPFDFGPRRVIRA